MTLTVSLLTLSILIGQMLRIPLGNQGVQIIDIVILVISIHIFLSYAFRIGLVQNYHKLAILEFIIWLYCSLIYGLMHYLFGALSIPDLFAGLLAASRFFIPLLIFSYALSADINSESVQFYLRILYYSGITVVTFGVGQAIFIENFAIKYGPAYGWDWDVQGNRLVSIFLDPNLAASFTSGIVIFSVLLIKKNIIPNKILIIGAFLSLMGTFLTLSRGGIIGLIIGLIILFINNKEKLKFFRLSNIALFSVLFLLIALIIVNIFGIDFLIQSDRFGASNDSALIRFNNYMGLLNIFIEYPFFGVGFNFARSLYADYFFGFSGNYVDGGVLVLLASLGAVGLFILIIALVAFKKAARLDSYLFSPFILMFVVQSFATSTIFYPLIICYFALILGLTQRILKGN